MGLPRRELVHVRASRYDSIHPDGCAKEPDDGFEPTQYRDGPGAFPTFVMEVANTQTLHQVHVAKDKSLPPPAQSLITSSHPQAWLAHRTAKATLGRSKKKQGQQLQRRAAVASIEPRPRVNRRSRDFVTCGRHHRICDASLTRADFSAPFPTLPTPTRANADVDPTSTPHARATPWSRAPT